MRQQKWKMHIDMKFKMEVYQRKELREKKWEEFVGDKIMPKTSKA